MWYMSLSSYFVKLAATMLAQYSVIHLFHHLLLSKLLATTDDVHLWVATSYLPATSLLRNVRRLLLSKIDRLPFCRQIR